MNEIDLRRIDLNLLVLFDVLMTERSVSRTAERLGRTQSAVSHALSRLREQLGDPLLVKVAAGMQPSPFALQLVDQVRPLLASLRRVLSPGRAFTPATSRRTFTVCLPDWAAAIFPSLLARTRDQAPGVSLEWVAYRESAVFDLLEGRLDAGLAPAALRLPEGIASESIGALRWACFGRERHPAFRQWNRKAWSRWPHAVVRVGDRIRSPVEVAASAAGLARTVGARVPVFAAVAPLLAASDLLATLPAIVMVDASRRYGIAIRPVPFSVEPMPHVLVWNASASKDPESEWLRGLLRTVIDSVFTAAERVVPVNATRGRQDAGNNPRTPSRPEKSRA